MERLTHTSEELMRIQEVQNLVQLGKSQNYLSYDDINSGLPDYLSDHETLDNLFILFDDMNISVSSEPKKNAKSTSSPDKHRDNNEISSERPTSPSSDNNQDNCDDPAKVYLKEISKVTLLTAEEESRLSDKIHEGETLISKVIYSSKYTLFAVADTLNLAKSNKIPVTELFPGTNNLDPSPEDNKNHKDCLDKIISSTSKAISSINGYYHELESDKLNPNQRKKLHSAIRQTIKDGLNTIKQANLSMRHLMDIVIHIEKASRTLLEATQAQNKLIASSKSPKSKEVTSLKSVIRTIREELGGSDEDIIHWYNTIADGKAIIFQAKEELVQSNLRL
ncbi:MAG: hypothetical protein OEZ36_06300, partial [Spirochaetota bacterium]|nr:hypothetical protein [Spirochaetota bacterium]